MKQNKPLDEMWVLPRNVKSLPYTFYGQKIYSSEKLKTKFFKAILATSWGKFHSKNIKRLIEKDYVVPALLDDRLKGFISKKFFSDNWTKDVMGVYASDLNKVIIFIDNNSNFLGLSSNKTLVKTTLHECMHLSASTNTNGFFKIMAPTFKNYYGNYFREIFACEEVQLDKTLKSLYKLEGVMNTNLHRSYMQNLRNETQSISTLSRDEYDNIYNDIYSATRIFSVSPNLLMRYYGKFYHIFKPLDSAYMETFRERNSYTTAAQELWAPSEVASVMVELLPVDSRVSQILSNIK